MNQTHELYERYECVLKGQHQASQEKIQFCRHFLESLSTCQLYCLAIFQFVFCWREWTQDNEHDYHRNLGKNGKLPCPFCPTVVCFVRCSLEDQGPTVPPGTPGLGSSRLTYSAQSLRNLCEGQAFATEILKYKFSEFGGVLKIPS